MLMGYMRVSKSDGSQTTDPQLDQLLRAGVAPDAVYEDRASGRDDDRPGLAACLKALREGDTLVVVSLDRLGRSTRSLLNRIGDLTDRKILLKVLGPQGELFSTTGPYAVVVTALFAALAEVEAGLVSSRTKDGLAAARARGRVGGRPPKMTPAKIRLAQAAMGQPETVIGELCRELGVSSQTLYRHVSPTGELRPDGEKLLARSKATR